MPIEPYSRSELDLAKVDWSRVDATSDEDIARQAAEDVDTAPLFTPDEILAAGRRIESPYADWPGPCSAMRELDAVTRALSGRR